MANDWTKPQEKAIEARGMQVLVSAAAGSGKTAVLTERVKNILSDTDNKCSVSEILVVTFTKAAATEMRDRISDALQEEANLKNENSNYLRHQILMLPTADICTMDSFCAKIVRENFSKADVSFDFRILDNNEVDKLTSEAIDIVVEELYEEDDESFRNLIEMFVGENNDNSLKTTIAKLYEFSLSYPFPDVWLDALQDSFDVTKAPNDTVWADIMYKFVGMFADYYKKILDKTLLMMEDAGDFNPKFIDKFVYSSEKLSDLIESVKNRSWDTMVSIIRDGVAISVNLKNPKANENIKNIAMDVYNTFLKDAKSFASQNLPLEEEHRNDNEGLYPVVSKLCYAVKRLDEVLRQMKSEMNAYSFSDILHKCIDLLVESDGEGNWLRTSICDSLVSRYKEILIDEYQDTNEAQNIIFEALSRDKSNLYVVGDVKQSIYRFRLASPGLFMNLKHTLAEYDGSKMPSQISLDTNFRSREGIDETVNYLFDSIMSEAIGDVDYNDKEKMTFGATYPKKDTPDSEIICINCDGLNSAQCSEVEAEAIAQYIERVMKSEIEITVKKKQRKIEYGDFCILLRGLKDKVDLYVDALKRYNIPYSASTDSNISEFKEIRILISLIKAINNPMMDIPLIAIMLSPLYGFTSDELAEIRLVNEYTEMYTCLNEMADKNEKICNFLNKLRLYRNISASYPVDEFVRFVIDDTGIKNIYLADENGRQRHNNIVAFMNFATNYTKNIGGGLNSFIKYVDSAFENEGFEGVANLKASEGVKIMSIHKSKGLEFPYVIVGGCSKGFNRQDSYGSLVVARETGIGMKMRDNKLFTKYHTLSSIGTEKAILMGDVSESLRVLYVAMTRAKEHLTFISTISGKQLASRVRINNMTGFDDENKLHPYAVFKAGSMSEWILSVFAKHRDCDIVRDALGVGGCKEKVAEFGVDCSYYDSEDFFLEDTSAADDAEKAQPDETLLENIREKLKFSYEYDFGGVLAKRAASSTEKNAMKREYFARSKPEFMKDKFTGADRGTAIHKFLEKCDFKLASDSVSDEKNRLLSAGIINEKEFDVVSDSDLKMFFDSAIVKRMLDSDVILKEYEFSVLKKAGEIYPEIQKILYDEEIVVQGKLDCAFIENGNAVLIDYKSDGIINESEYIAIYKPQIDIYSEALEKCKGCKVTERYIYSFKLNKFIPL